MCFFAMMGWREYWGSQKNSELSLFQQIKYAPEILLKGTVAPTRVLLKVIWLERAKLGEEPLSVFKIFHSSFDF
jgi:hypothetical protein